MKPQTLRVVKGVLVVAGIGLGLLGGLAALGPSHALAGVYVVTQRVFQLGTPVTLKLLRTQMLAAVQKAGFDEAITKTDRNRADFEKISEYRHMVYYDDQRNRIEVEAHINADGFRGRAVTREKPREITRIVVIGDSHTFGFGLRDDEPFPAVLEQLLNARGQMQAEVLNLGCPGLNLVEKLDVLRSKGLIYHPDLVILQYDGDDMFPQRFRQWEGQTLTRLLGPHATSAFDPDRMGLLTDTGRERLVDRLGKPILLTNMIEQPLSELITTSQRSGFRLLIIGTWVGREDEDIVKRSAARYDIPYLNVFEEALHERPYPISRYERHFNKQGQALIAAKLCDMIVSRLRK